nr:ribonuclease H-like domain-containing protein [Tanacetum cinerariifolium]
SNLLARDPLPDVKDAFAVVSREESHRGLAYDKITAKTNPTTFVAKTNNGNNNFNNNGRVNSNNNSNRGPNPNLFNGNNVDASQSGSTSSGSMAASFTNDHMIKLLSLINEKPAANVSGSMAGKGSCLRDYLQTKVMRSSRPKSQPVRFNDCVVSSNVKYGLEKFVCYSKLPFVNYCFSTILNKSVDTKSYIEAYNDENWINAMNLEMEALHRNGTWHLADLPVGRKTIGSKWIYRIMYKASGEIDRYKARCLIGLAISKNAFLYGDLNEEVYMALPLGYYDKNETKRKYCLELLTEYGLLACKPIATPLQQNTIHMHAPLQPHFNARLRVLRYLKHARGTEV